jgi:predicted secreted protein
MAKKIISLVVFLLVQALFYAGDAAFFVDLGFSSDGQTYMFGEYGKTDVTFQGYANIYTIDVNKNDYVPGGVFHGEGGGTNPNKSSRAVFNELQEQAAFALARYSPLTVPLKRTLFLHENERKSPLEELNFKDYERATGQDVFYKVRLSPTFSGTGAGTKSTLEIRVEERDARGELRHSYRVGNPTVQRSGITAYAISKIFTDESGKSLVFVVEKTVADSTGSSIRYMVESTRRPSAF